MRGVGFMGGEYGAGRTIGDCDCVVDSCQVVFGRQMGYCDFASLGESGVCWESYGNDGVYVRRAIWREDMDAVFSEEVPGFDLLCGGAGG